MTKGFVRLSGAQIPVHNDNIQFNKKEILNALDWGKENEVDLLLTPECALTGYNSTWIENFEEVKEALKEIENHQKKVGVGLHLGTMFKEPEAHGDLHRNEIRHYEKGGNLISITNKCYLIGSHCNADQSLVPGMTPCEIIGLPFYESSGIEREYKGVGLICNDLWGDQAYCDHTPNEPIMQRLKKAEPELILHATNGIKYPSDILKEFYGDRGQDVVDTMDAYHDGAIRQVALKTVCSILTVDSCVPWHWGENAPIDQCMTATQSGFVDPLGKWMTDTPRYGRQYFYYDYDVTGYFKYRPESIGVQI